MKCAKRTTLAISVAVVRPPPRAQLKRVRPAPNVGAGPVSRRRSPTNVRTAPAPAGAVARHRLGGPEAPDAAWSLRRLAIPDRASNTSRFASSAVISPGPS